MRKKLKVVNIFGAPCSGKSTAAAGLFALMKRDMVSVELVTEFAKDLVWSESHKTMEDQLLVLAQQHHRIWRLNGKVEWVVTDSPLLLSYIYTQYKGTQVTRGGIIDQSNASESLPTPFYELTYDLFDEHENHNFLLERSFPYTKMGRGETEAESLEIHKMIRNQLEGIPHLWMESTWNTPEMIYDEINIRRHN